MNPKRYAVYTVLVIAMSAAVFYMLSSSTTTTLIESSEPVFASSTTAVEQPSDVRAAARDTAGTGFIATLKVAGKTYAPRVQDGASVLDAMKAAEADGFSFSGNEYPSLGIYIDTIGGKKAEDGFYWILYINGKTSTTGAAQTILTAQDTAEWKFEKGY